MNVNTILIHESTLYQWQYLLHRLAIHFEEAVLVLITEVRGSLYQCVNLRNGLLDGSIATCPESSRNHTHLLLQGQGIGSLYLLCCTRLLVITNKHCVHIRTFVSSLQEPLSKLIVKLVHSNQNSINGGSCMKSCHRHVLLGTCAIHSSMLKHRVLLEILWIATIEETQHILDGYTSIENVATDENVGSSI